MFVSNAEGRRLRGLLNKLSIRQLEERLTSAEQSGNSELAQLIRTMLMEREAVNV